PTNRILTLRPDSPCAPPASDCGVMGALGVACPPTAVSLLPLPGLATRLLPTRPHPATIPVRFAFELARASMLPPARSALLGRRVATVVSRELEAGQNEATWNGETTGGTRVDTGFYVAVLEAGGARDTRRFLLLRR